MPRSQGNLHRHMIEEAEPADRVLQERVGFLLQTSPPLRHPVVPHVLRLEVLVDGQEDGVVGGSHPGPRPSQASPSLLLLLASRCPAQQLDGGATGQPDQRVGRALAGFPKEARNWKEVGRLVLHLDLDTKGWGKGHFVPSSVVCFLVLIAVLLLIGLIVLFIVFLNLVSFSLLFLLPTILTVSLLRCCQVNFIEVNL